MSAPITIGFSDGAFSAVSRTGAGALLCRRGDTQSLDPPVIAWRAADRRWQAQADCFDISLEPLGEAAGFADGSREWLCLVTGSVDATTIECLGQVILGGDAGSPDRRRTTLLRSLTAWFDADLGFAVHARRPARAETHEAEALEAIVLRGAPPEPVRIADPRLSTAYDAACHPRRAGLELWENDESDYALRVAGETIGEGELKLPGGGVLRTAFLLWRHAGLVGTGRYDIALPPPPSQ